MGLSREVFGYGANKRPSPEDWAARRAAACNISVFMLIQIQTTQCDMELPRASGTAGSYIQGERAVIPDT